MKTKLLIILPFLLIAGCGADTSKVDVKKQPKIAQIETTAKISEVIYVSLELELAKKSGCLACHAVDKKVIGPAWRDVSSRYINDNGARTRLINKIKKGGKGNWTEITGGVPMPPYSPRVSDENIGKLVDFVLGLSK